MAVKPRSALSLLLSASPYALYVLLVLMVVYLLNQLDRFVLGIAGRSIARDLQFGQLGCYLDDNRTDNITNISSCSTICHGKETEEE